MISETNDTKILTNLRNAQNNYPELRELLGFYEKLFQLQFNFKSQLLTLEGPSASQNKIVNVSLLSAGIPQAIFNDLQLEHTGFNRFVVQMFEFLKTYCMPGREGANIEMPDRTARELAHLIFESGNPIIVSEAAENIHMLAAGLALVPYLQIICERIMPHIDQNVWMRNYCPICGGKPCFAALDKETGARSMLCSRCNSVWRYGRVGCHFCGNTEVQVYYSSDDGRYRLYVCDECKRYIKTIDLRMAGDNVCLPVENIITVAMDIAAQEKGYRHY